MQDSCLQEEGSLVRKRLEPFNPTEREMVARMNVFPLQLEGGEMLNQMSGTSFVGADISGDG